MSFRVMGLDPTPFFDLYGSSEAELLRRGVQRVVADRTPGYPDRIEVRDAEPAETLLLLNYTHQPANSPYRASHAIYVREGAMRAYDAVGEIPRALYTRPISLRAFDPQGMMVDAQLAQGAAVARAIRTLLLNPAVSYLQAHYARPGCYAARIERA